MLVRMNPQVRIDGGEWRDLVDGETINCAGHDVEVRGFPPGALAGSNLGPYQFLAEPETTGFLVHGGRGRPAQEEVTPGRGGGH